jgi:hypothetical protein
LRYRSNSRGKKLAPNVSIQLSLFIDLDYLASSCRTEFLNQELAPVV